MRIRFLPITTLLLIACFFCFLAAEAHSEPSAGCGLAAPTTPGVSTHLPLPYATLNRGYRLHLPPGYDPNTSHVICGQDADLVMLGLVTHEAHVFILREEVPVEK